MYISQLLRGVYIHLCLCVFKGQSTVLNVRWWKITSFQLLDVHTMQYNTTQFNMSQYKAGQQDGCIFLMPSKLRGPSSQEDTPSKKQPKQTR